MQKKTKWILIGLAAIMITGIAVILALRYFPFHKLMKRPSSVDMAFVNQPQAPGSAPFSLSFDFEVDTTAKTPSGLYRGIAHSGVFSTKAFGKNSFSISMDRKVSELGASDLKSAALSCWVYVLPTDNEPEAALVLTVTNTVGVNTCWKGVSLRGPLVPREKWFKISGSFNLSDVQIRPDDKIQIYFWNNSSTDILVDDFYVVFGSQAPRKGDSARVDMTKGIPFQPRFNYPPFQTVLLEREDIGNLGSALLVNDGTRKEGEITPEDQVTCGAFISGGGGLESVFVLKPDGTPELYHFCTHDKSFRKITVECPPTLKPFLKGASMKKGSFLGKGNEELLFENGKGILLAMIDKSGDPCGKGPVKSVIRELWRSEGPEINGIKVGKENPLTVCDVNGDKLSELLLVRPGGAWELLSFKNGGWKTLATGEEYKLREWDSKFSEFSITPGRFLGSASGDQLLTTFSDKLKKTRNYSLVRFVPGEKKFVSALTGAERSVGKTVGLDTLKLADHFLQGSFVPGLAPFFLRYNRDWRYDLKEIRFNDSTFAILGNVDFSGFERDFNPKYYETLGIIPGRILNPAVTSLLVIARNSEELPYLPNTIQVYSFPSKTKK